MKCGKCGKEFSERVFGIHIINCKPKAIPVQIEEKPADEVKAVTPAKPVKPAGKAKNE
jgi:hypothetical protein